MNSDDWLILCHVLKNLLDSHGIAVAQPVVIVNYGETNLASVLANDDEDGTLLVDADQPVGGLHVTMGALMGSRFTLPAADDRRQMCEDVARRLKENEPSDLPAKHGDLLKRLRSAWQTSETTAENEVRDQWEAQGLPDWTETPCVTELPTKRVMILADVVVTPTGDLIMALPPGFVDQVERGHIARRLPGVSADQTRAHVTLGHARSPRAHQMLRERLGSNTVPVQFCLMRAETHVVAYRHRSLDAIARAIPFKCLSGGYAHVG